MTSFCSLEVSTLTLAVIAGSIFFFSSFLKKKLSWTWLWYNVKEYRYRVKLQCTTKYNQIPVVDTVGIPLVKCYYRRLTECRPIYIGNNWYRRIPIVTNEIYFPWYVMSRRQSSIGNKYRWHFRWPLVFRRYDLPTTMPMVSFHRSGQRILMMAFPISY